MEEIAGCFGLLSFTLNVSLVGAATVIGSWISQEAELHTVNDSSSEDAEGVPEPEAELSDESEEAELVAFLKDSMQMPESVGDKRKRLAVPQGIQVFGGLRNAFLFFLALFMASALLAISQKDPNAFELFGLFPSVLRERTVGLTLRQALMRGVDSSWSVTPEQVANASKILRDQLKRETYDLYGVESIRLATVMDLFLATLPQWLFYLFWASYLWLLSSTFRRASAAFSAGGTAMGIVMFLDMSTVLDPSTLREYEWLNVSPGFASMTCFERQVFLRHIVVPPLLVACIYYSVHQFVDHPENELLAILRLLALSVQTDKTVQNVTVLGHSLHHSEGEESQQVRESKEEATALRNRKTNVVVNASQEDTSQHDNDKAETKPNNNNNNNNNRRNNKKNKKKKQ